MQTHKPLLFLKKAVGILFTMMLMVPFGFYALLCKAFSEEEE